MLEKVNSREIYRKINFYKSIFLFQAKNVVKIYKNTNPPLQKWPLNLPIFETHL